MALKPCKECGHKISSKAKTCPQCGVDNPATGALGRDLGCGSGCGVLILIVVGVGIVSAITNTDWSSNPIPQPQPAPRPEPIPLTAFVEASSVELVITNNDSFAWSNCSVELNAGMLRGGYEQRMPTIGAGEVVTGGLGAFTKSDGERFDPATYALQRVDIHCDTPRGRRHYNGFF